MKNLLLLSALVLAIMASTVVAADKEADKQADAKAKPAETKAKPGENTISFADGKLQLMAPDAWKRKKPDNQIIEHEFAIPAAEGDERDGRMTIMGAGGSIEQNIDRWVGQFSKSERQPKISKVKVAGEDVTLVDLQGTYEDKRGPFGGAAVSRENYRMLAAVISSKQLGNYFVKFYGPAKTVEGNEKAFAKMIEGMEKK